MNNRLFNRHYIHTFTYIHFLTTNTLFKHYNTNNQQKIKLKVFY